MSRINFDNLQADRPDLLGAWSGISAWFRKHPKIRQVELTRLAEGATSCNDEQLTDALFLMVKRGVLSRRFAVESPDGVLIEDVFDSPADVPEDLLDRSLRPFSRNDARIVSIFFVEDK